MEFTKFYKVKTQKGSLKRRDFVLYMGLEKGQKSQSVWQNHQGVATRAKALCVPMGTPQNELGDALSSHWPPQTCWALVSHLGIHFPRHHISEEMETIVLNLTDWKTGRTLDKSIVYSTVIYERHKSPFFFMECPQWNFFRAQKVSLSLTIYNPLESF